MSHCPHGCPPNWDADDESASGECYTCLARVGTCGCDYCIKALQAVVDKGTAPTQPQWHSDWLVAQKFVITKETYHHVYTLCSMFCDCEHPTDAPPPTALTLECYQSECTLCSVRFAPCGDPLHTHHDGCAAGCDE